MGHSRPSPVKKLHSVLLLAGGEIIREGDEGTSTKRENEVVGNSAKK